MATTKKTMTRKKMSGTSGKKSGATARSRKMMTAGKSQSSKMMKSGSALEMLRSDFDTQAVLHDFLNTQKLTTGNYNTFAGECMHSDLRNDVLHILDEEHAIQNTIFEEMKERGFYPIKAANKTMIGQAKKKFECQ